MEDVARLAVIEQTLSDVDKFNKVLHDLLQQIDLILKNPHDLEQRTLKSNYLKKAIEHEVFCDYLKYIGFELVQGKYIFPKEKALLKLQLAKTAIQRKISICYGSKRKFIVTKTLPNFALEKKPKLKPVNLMINNYFVRKIQNLFNEVLKYEDEELQALAREQIPLITLQIQAIERVREHQKKLKIGEVEGNDLSYEIALLMELMTWFKYQFFSWVDKPNCEKCGGTTVHHKNEILKTETETCRVEIYRCTKCMAKDGGARFPRYNDPATLLRTRKGRCGEWANCFMLLLRALGYDSRYVYDTTDHVWCEVYDQVNSKWLHVDPCECVLDAPLTYCCGWGKKLSYVVGVSRDDVQDVTWRYSTSHREVRNRRDQCNELELISALMSLRSTRQLLVSESRRRYLVKRCLKELVQLMIERHPSDKETGGRVSGASVWRKERCEVGASEGHTFEYERPGSYSVEYCCAEDRYRLIEDQSQRDSLDGWNNGCFYSKGVFRKHETDWGQVYLAREESLEEGSIAWRVAVGRPKLVFDHLVVELHWARYGEGRLIFTLQFDADPPMQLAPDPKITNATWHFRKQFVQCVLRCQLSGGSGDVAWQHAQLFRQPVAQSEPAMRLTVNVIDLPHPNNIKPFN